MKILKRNGQYEDISFDKILKRIQNLSKKEPLLNTVSCDLLSQEIIGRIYDGISSSELDELGAQLSINKRYSNLEYGELASRIIISNLHKKTLGKFSDAMELLYENSLVNESFIEVVRKNAELLDLLIDNEKDYTYDYFAFKTLEKSYLYKIDGVIIERPQYMLLRVSIGIHYSDIHNVISTYRLLSQKFFTHASPTLFNSGSNRQQYSSCFILDIHDSMEGIYKCLTDCALISKYAGGIGFNVSNIRAKNSKIKGTNGKTDGIGKMLKVFNETGNFSNQGGKRNGSIAIYLSTWHADIFEFLELSLKHGDEKKRARDLFYALWVSDLFMKKVENDEDWYLMSPDDSPGLNNVYSTEFEELYNNYVSKGVYRKKIKARELWDKILVTQIETGMPYITYKDSVNIKNNQKNVGTIQSSNLCVSPDTFILTDRGYKPIGLLENQEVNVWNSQKFTKTKIVKTGTNQKILKVSLSNGISLKTTEYHHFYLNKNGEKVKVNACLLKENDVLIDTRYPILTTSYYSDYPLAYESGKNFTENIVPYNYSNEIKREWLQGFFKKNIEEKQIFFDDYYNLIYTHQNSSTNYILTELKFLLNTIQIDCVIKESNICIIQNKYTQILKEFLNEIYLCDTMFDTVKKYHISFTKETFDIKVTDISEIGYSDTFCFTEKELGLGIFNGVLTGQCNEINIYSDTTEYSCCNLASISLPAFIDSETNNIDYLKLEEVVGQIVINMNKIIDNNYYPVPETRKSNMRHRPIGIGVQGFADLLYRLKSPFESESTKRLNIKIFETIYYSAIKMSCELAKKEGPYSTFEGSPFSKGIFQFDYYPELKDTLLSGRYNWELLKEEVKKYGIRNSLLTACMPTASTASILNNFESFEPATHNLFVRKVLSGEYVIVNKYLIEDLMKLGIWNNDFYNKFKQSYGSIQNFTNIPENLKMLYKDIYEIPQKVLIDLSADRQAFIDQSQSLNVYFKNPTIKKLTSMHFYGWKRGLKTGLYYLRSSSAVDSAQITVNETSSVSVGGKLVKSQDEIEQQLLCSLQNKEACEMCSG